MSFRRALKKLEVQQTDHKVEVAGQFINKDTIPLPPSQRNYGVWSFIGIWMVTGSFNVGGWTTGSSILSLGLNVWQAMLVVIIGHVLNGFICVGTGWPGGKYHIGYPVLQRSTWGTRGADWIIGLRIILTFVWISTQTYWGGQCVKTLLGSLAPSLYNLNQPLAGGTMVVADFIGFIVYWLICLPIIWVRPQKYHAFFFIASAVMGTAVFSLLGYFVHTAGGAGALVTNRSKLTGVEQAEGSDLGFAFAYGISSMFGGLAVHLVHQADYTRFAKRPGDQFWGQIFIVPMGTIINSLIGILVTSCAAQMYPSRGLMWQPYQLLQAIQQESQNSSGSRAAIFFLSVAFTIGQIGLTVCGNAFSGGIDLAGLFPRYFTIRRGAYFTFMFAFIMQPWQLLNGASIFLTVIGVFSTFLAPMIAILIADFFIVRKKRLSLLNLFINSEQSIYWGWNGYNLRCWAAWIAGVFPFVPGFAANVRKDKTMAGWIKVYKLGFILGFCIGFVVYLTLNKIFPPPQADLEDDEDYFGCESDELSPTTDRKMSNENIKDDEKDVEATGSNVRVIDA